MKGDKAERKEATRYVDAIGRGLLSALFGDIGRVMTQGLRDTPPNDHDAQTAESARRRQGRETGRSRRS